MRNSTIIVIVLAVILITGAAYYAGLSHKELGSEEKTDPDSAEGIFVEREIEGNKDDLVSFSVQPNQEVSGILNFSGSVRNAYFFEANIRVNILDENKKVLKEGHGTATTDWMTAEPVAFSGTIDLTGLSTGPGYIQIANDNPSGLPEHDKFIFIPILIGE